MIGLTSLPTAAGKIHKVFFVLSQIINIVNPNPFSICVYIKRRQEYAKCLEIFFLYTYYTFTWQEANLLMSFLFFSSPSIKHWLLKIL